MPEPTPSLTALEMHDDFMRRHIGPDRTQCAQMPQILGLRSLDDLIDRAGDHRFLCASGMTLDHDSLAFKREQWPAHEHYRLGQ